MAKFAFVLDGLIGMHVALITIVIMIARAQKLMMHAQACVATRMLSAMQQCCIYCTRKALPSTQAAVLQGEVQVQLFACNML